MVGSVFGSGWSVYLADRVGFRVGLACPPADRVGFRVGLTCPSADWVGFRVGLNKQTKQKLLLEFGDNLEEVLVDEVDLLLKVVEGLAPLVKILGRDGGEVQLPLDLQVGKAQAPGQQQSLHANAMPAKDCWYFKNIQIQISQSKHKYLLAEDFTFVN